LFRTLEYKSGNIATFPIHEQLVFFSQRNALNKVQFLFLASGGVRPKTVGLHHFTTLLTPLDVVSSDICFQQQRHNNIYSIWCRMDEQNYMYVFAR